MTHLALSSLESENCILSTGKNLIHMLVLRLFYVPLAPDRSHPGTQKCRHPFTMSPFTHA